MADNERCCKQVGHDGWGIKRCSRNAVVTEDGKPYCAQHAPSAVKARRAATSAKWDRECAIENAKYAVQQAEARLVEGCVRANMPEAREVIEARAKLAKLLSG